MTTNTQQKELEPDTLAKLIKLEEALKNGTVAKKCRLDKTNTSEYAELFSAAETRCIDYLEYKCQDDASLIDVEKLLAATLEQKDPYPELPLPKDRADLMNVSKRLRLWFAVPENARYFADEFLSSGYGGVIWTTIETVGNRDDKLLDREPEYFVVQEWERRIVRRIAKRDVKQYLSRKAALEASLYAATNYGRTDFALSSTVSNEIVKHWMDNVAESPRVVTYKSYDDTSESFCFYQCPVVPDFDMKLDDMPVTKNMLSRHSDPEFLLAFLAGLLTKRYRGRQSIWDYSRGNTGRSSFYSTILNECMGINRGYGVVPPSGSTSNKHFYHGLEGVGVGYVGECNNRAFLRTEHFKTLTGYDVAKVDPKGVDGHNATMAMNFIILSNHLPDMPDEESTQSRVVVTETAPLLVERKNADDVQAMVRKELPGILALGIRQYEKPGMVTNDQFIRLNDRSIELKSLLTEEYNAVYDGFVQQYLIINEDDDNSVSIAYSALHALWKAHFAHDHEYKKQYTEFLNNYLTLKYPQVVKFTSNGARIGEVKFRSMQVIEDAFKRNGVEFDSRAFEVRSVRSERAKNKSEGIQALMH